MELIGLQNELTCTAPVNPFIQSDKIRRSSPTPRDVSCWVAFVFSLYINKTTPMTIIKVNKYFFRAYDFRPTNTPKIMTGIGFADFPTTCNCYVVIFYLA